MRRRWKRAKASRKVSGRSWMTRNRCTTSTKLITLEEAAAGCLDIKHEGFLIAAKHAVADQHCRYSARQGHGYGCKLWEQAIIDAQAKAIQNVEHWVQLEQPAMLSRNKIQGVNYGRKIEPG